MSKMKKAFAVAMVGLGLGLSASTVMAYPTCPDLARMCAGGLTWACDAYDNLCDFPR